MENILNKEDAIIELYLKDTLIAEYNNGSGEVTIHEPELLPFNLRDVKGNNPISDTVKKQTAFHNWCSSRILNINRANAKKILNALNYSQSEEGKFLVSMACHSVSLSDSYWTKLNVETDLNWDNINLYSNHFSEVIRHIALTGDLTITGKIVDNKTPEITGQGAYAKAWRREEFYLCGMINLEGGGMIVLTDLIMIEKYVSGRISREEFIQSIVNGENKADFKINADSTNYIKNDK